MSGRESMSVVLWVMGMSVYKSKQQERDRHAESTSFFAVRTAGREARCNAQVA